jgi:DNA-binding LytR/AlgR family response regulator
MKVLIIEDEKKAARELSNLIELVRPEAEVIGVI